LPAEHPLLAVRSRSIGLISAWLNDRYWEKRTFV